MTKTVGLYIHVPFCVTKCNYCKFYSNEYSEIQAKSWKTDVVRELSKHEQIQYDTVFFGGGTPSLLWREVCEILPTLPLTGDCEVTVECNPDDVTEQMLRELQGAGVNRLSIGVQSLDDTVLRRLGRRHNSAQAVQAVQLAHEAGFDNVSVDIMLGIPGQSLTSVDPVHKLPVSHISAYIYENEHTLSEDEIADMYLRAVEMFGNQYEVSNFGKPCKHNLKYWRCEEYIGIGQTAHSYYNGKRFAMDENWQTYVTEENPATYEEKVMLGLRLTEGVTATEELLQRARLIPSEYVSINGSNISLTPKGFLISNKIIGELLQ